MSLADVLKIKCHLKHWLVDRDPYPKGSNHLLRMVIEPKYIAEEGIEYLNHPLTR